MDQRELNSTSVSRFHLLSAGDRLAAPGPGAKAQGDTPGREGQAPRQRCPRDGPRLPLENRETGNKARSSQGNPFLPFFLFPLTGI